MDGRWCSDALEQSLHRRSHDGLDVGRRLKALDDVALPVDEELREVPLDVRLALPLGVGLAEQVDEDRRDPVLRVEAGESPLALEPGVQGALVLSVDLELAELGERDAEAARAEGMGCYSAVAAYGLFGTIPATATTAASSVLLTKGLQLFVAIALMVLGLIVAWNCLKELLHVKPGSMPDEESEWSELGRKRYAAAQTDAKAPKTTSETVTE